MHRTLAFEEISMRRKPLAKMTSGVRLAAVVFAVMIGAGDSPARAAVLEVSDAPGFQSALDIAVCGDTIVLANGVTYTNNFTVTRDCASNPITIQRSGTLPAPCDLRTSSCIASFRSEALANAPKVMSANAAPAFASIKGARGYTVRGVQFGSAYNGGPSASPNIINFGEDGLGFVVRQMSDMPGTLVFDRVYVSGNATNGVRRGMALNAANWTVINTLIENVHVVGNESAGIGCWNCPGPFRIENTAIFAAGMGVLIGGADPSISNLIPSDGTVTRSLFSKSLTWNPGHPSYAGVRWSVKNAFELKNAQRVTLDRNVFEYSWLDAQVGYLVLFTGLNDGGACTWCTVKDVTFTNNIVRHGNAGMQLSGHLSYTVPQNIGPAGNNITIRNNLFYDINESWGKTSPLGSWLLIANDIYNVTIDHNTVDQVNTGHPTIIVASNNAMSGVRITNNFFNRGYYGLFAGDQFSEGSSTWLGKFQNSVFESNVIVNEFAPPPAYPASTEFIPLSTFRAQFRNYGNQDFTLIDSSPFKGAGTDGKDIGADMSAFGGGQTTSAPTAPTNLRLVQQ
jgi:hypothetical protein